MTLQHILSLPQDQVQYYWQTLAMEDTLKYRLNALVDPSWTDVLGMIRTHGTHMYCIMDDDNEIRGEFMLEAFTGKAAQIHFSMHPDNSWADTITYGIQGIHLILTEWKDNHGNPFLHSLYGNIAISNRASCITALKMGFKKLGLLPLGMYIARHDRYEDSTLLVRT